jgi:site-specific DNA recombinase
MGHVTKMRWNDADAWIWSAAVAHPALVDLDTHQRTRALLATRGARSPDRKPRASPRHYLLRGLLVCGVCGRRMQGQINNGKPHYRCRYPEEYAVRTAHPRNIYLREDAIVAPLDGWLARVFEPVSLPATVEALYAAQDAGEAEAATVQAAHQKVAECDNKLARYRAALEAGTDPAVVASWVAEVTASRAAADAQLRATKTRRRISRQEIHSLVSALGDLLGTLHDADPADKGEVYQRLGLRLNYQPGSGCVHAEARVGPGMGVMECPRGDLNPHALIGH